MVLIVILLLIATAILSTTVLIYRKFWETGLAAYVHFSETAIVEGQKVFVKVVAENRKILPLPTLMIKFEMNRNIQCVDSPITSLTDKQYRNEFMSIMPYERVTRTIEAVGKKRGFYCIEDVGFVTTDILFRSLFNKREENDAVLYVYPERSKYVQNSEIFCQMTGEIITNRALWEDSMEFKGIRDYVPTDPMQKINWKASARTAELKVNQYYDSMSERLTIFLNVSQNEILKYYDLIEESIRMVRNFIETFVSKGVPVRVISNGIDCRNGQELSIREGAGLMHIDTCLKKLATLDIYNESREMADIIQEQMRREKSTEWKKEISVLISAEQTEKLEQAYSEYVGGQGKGNWLVPIHKIKYVQEEEKRRTSTHRIQTEYVIIEELEG